MRLLKKGVVFLVIYFSVSFSKASFLGDQIETAQGNVLGQYFESMVIQERNNKHLLMIIAGGTQEQRFLTTPLLKTHPHVVGVNVTKLAEITGFNVYSYLIYFLDSLNEEYVREVMKNLFSLRTSRVHFISDKVRTPEDIHLVLRLAFEASLERAVFLQHENLSVKIYFFEQTTSDAMTVVLLGEWIRGAKIPRLHNLISNRTRRGYQGTVLRVGTAENMPWVGITEDANGEMKFDGGSEGCLMMEICKRLNFTPKLEVFSDARVNESSETETIISKLVTGKLDMGVGHIRTTEDFISQVYVSTPTGRECLIWCVPRITDWSQYILVAEFPWSTWFLIGLTFLFTCAVENFVRKVTFLNKGNARKSRFSLILDTIAITLGYPIVYRSISRGGKFLLLAYLCYSMIITTAYKTSLSSMLTVQTGQPLFTKTEDIIRENITIGGSKSALFILKDQAEDSELTRELIKRFVVYDNSTKALRQISEKKNLALLITRTRLAYDLNLLAKTRGSVFFDILDDCVLTYNTAFVARKGTRIVQRVNRIIQRLAETGFLQRWSSFNSGSTQFIKDMTNRLGSIKFIEEGHTLNRAKFFQLFYIYFALQGFCILVFLGELLVHKIQSKKRIARLELLKRSIKFKSAPTPPDCIEF